MSQKQLEHDVAKYIVRTARNLAGAPAIETCPVGLIPLLARDFYGRAGEPSAYQRFEKLSDVLPAPVKKKCEERFERLNALKPALTSEDDAAVQTALRSAVALAFEIAALIESAGR